MFLFFHAGVASVPAIIEQAKEKKEKKIKKERMSERESYEVMRRCRAEQFVCSSFQFSCIDVVMRLLIYFAFPALCFHCVRLFSVHVFSSCLFFFCFFLIIIIVLIITFVFPFVLGGGQSNVHD